MHACLVSNQEAFFFLSFFLLSLSLYVCSSRGKSEGSFWGGFLIGGTVFGVLGFLFAPQVSRALLNSERMKKLLGEGSENLEVS